MRDFGSSLQTTRRDFLVAAAGSVALGALRGRPLLAGNEDPKVFGIDLGFSLYGMKSLPLAEAMDICAKIGYSHVEFALLEGFPTALDVFNSDDRKAAVERLQALKLRLPCLMLNISLMADKTAHAAALESIGRAGALARLLVPDNPPILETVLGGKPDEWDMVRERMAARLSDWAEAATNAKTTIAIKAHVMSAVNSPDRLLWLLDQVKSPAIKVAYDYSHFELQRISMEESMQALLPHTKFIHVKDTVGEPAKFQFLLPGDGRTDYVKYFSLLKSHKYAGPVCVEVSGQIWKTPDYDPVAAARKCFVALSAALAPA